MTMRPVLLLGLTESQCLVMALPGHKDRTAGSL